MNRVGRHAPAPKGKLNVSLHRCHRPGHHVQPLHRLRPHRCHHRHGPARAPPDLPQARLGRAQSYRDSRQHQRRHHRSSPIREPLATRPRSRRHHQPARDHPAVGPRHRHAHPQRDRLAGHPRRPYGRRIRAGWRPGPLSRPDRAAAGQLLLRPKAPLAAGQCTQRPRPRRSRRPRLRHHRHLAAMAPHRPAHHRCNERQPHPTDEPRHPRLGRLPPIRIRHPSLGSSRYRSIFGGLRHRPRPAGGRPRRRHPRRPAGGADGPSLLPPWRGQEHLRHRQLSADAHRHYTDPRRNTA